MNSWSAKVDWRQDLVDRDLLEERAARRAGNVEVLTGQQPDLPRQARS